MFNLTFFICSEGAFIFDEEDEGKESKSKKRDAHLYDDMPYDYLDENMDVQQKLEQKEFIKDNSDYHPSRKTEDVTSNVNSGTGFWDYRDKSNILRSKMRTLLTII